MAIAALRVMKMGIGVPFFVVILLAMMILPIPPFILDFLFTFNISFALLILLSSIYASRPLDFAVFPSVLLLATLLRLALNIASTRVILLHGHHGGSSAGHVIESFGEVVIGGNYAVGFIVFMILVIVNFMVVTKGAGRISEVSARFTLDAMPGKQMAIDADLNAGALTQEEARLRRKEVGEEADFYGAMDGSSKFVRGDAIAGILILVINLLGGIPIGMLQHNLAFSESLKFYSLLSIGDGLVAQIPALLLSVASAILVTRVSSSQDMGQEVRDQLFSNMRPLWVAGSILCALGIIPGMPHIAFIGMGGVMFVLGIMLNVQRENVALLHAVHDKKKGLDQAAVQSMVREPGKDEVKEIGWDDISAVDSIQLEVGYRLISLVSKEKGGTLGSRLKGVRKKCSQEFGFLIPTIHICDSSALQPNAYTLSIKGVILGSGEVYPEKELAINPGQVFGTVDGVVTTDPSFGLPAVWIDKGRREQAQSLGYTVVDAATVIATHLSHVLQGHVHQLLGHDELQKMLELLGKTGAKLVEELIPGSISFGHFLQLLQNLLEEGIAIRDLRGIAEAVIEQQGRNLTLPALTEHVRERLGSFIVQTLNGSEQELPVITLDPDLEQILQQAVQSHAEQCLEPSMLERIREKLQDFAKEQETQGKAPILLVPAALRRMLASLLRYSVSNVSVLSYKEVPYHKNIVVVATLG
jgi:flagellar biosynthesis protein FlhA